MYPLDQITLPTIKEDDLDDVPRMGVKMANPQRDHRNVIEHDQWRQAVQGYLASISFADATLGKVLEAFDASTHKDNTTVILWSDHGWHLGEKLHWRKFALWEEATHNVMMINSPGLTKPRSRCDQAVELMDIHPTLVDICGLAPRNELEGTSLRSLLENPALERECPALTSQGLGNHAIRNEKWRYIRYRDGTEELYDHENDPLEWTNLAGEPQHDGKKIELARWLPKTDAPESPPVQ